MSPLSTILVVGATGKVGGAVVRALLDLPQPPKRILALTRDASRPGAQALVQRGAAKGVAVELVQGNSTEPAPLFAARPRGDVEGLFVITVPGKVDEEDQAIPLIDAAVAHGVRHVVFSSVERGGDARSWENPTDIKHFYQKHNVELHLRDKIGSGGATTWTILRPVAFYDNMNPGPFCAVFTAMWAASLKPAARLQNVAVRDIGLFAARAFADPARWAGRAVGLAGDEITLAEARAAFRRALPGRGDLPQYWSVVGRLLLLGLPEVRRMFHFFAREGYHADIEALRREEPRLQNFETWLRESSGWAKQK